MVSSENKKKPHNRKKITLAIITVIVLFVVGIITALSMLTNSEHDDAVDSLRSLPQTANTPSHAPSPTVSPTVSETILPTDEETIMVTEEDATTNTVDDGVYVEVQEYRGVTERAPYQTNDVNSSVGTNYVLIGSDVREEGSVEGQRSDTTMLVHVSHNKDRVDVVSIPRDTMVHIPSCALENGGVTEAQTVGMFNSAFAQGDSMASAIACTINTIEANTGVRVDGYAVIDFTGFEQVVNDIGGITVDVPYRMVSSKANLDVNAGVQVMDGATALAYARARTLEIGGGDGSDLSRIDRQQQVMNAIMKRILSVQSLSNPVETYRALESIQNSVTTSENLTSMFTQTQLVMAGAGETNFYTTPVVPYTYDANRVMWTQEALTMWQNIHDDTPIG